MLSQKDKGERFRALHTQNSAFIIPNPWDVGSARLLAGLGFPALTTTSSGFARAHGLRDYQLGRERVLKHVAELAAAVDVPVAGDLENGFGDAPEACAETIRLAGQAGLVGGSIEDATGRAEAPLYEFAHAVDRVRAAVEAARALPFPFVLTARAEGFLRGKPDLADVIARAQAFQQAGADVLFAPGLRTAEDIRTLVRSVDRPVNVMIGPGLSVKELSDLGVRRVSLGGSLASAATSALLRAARELLATGTFGYTRELAPAKEIDALLALGAADAT
jgi:2-methylisocitrate lyase-like PEP mutase family enzyme